MLMLQIAISCAIIQQKMVYYENVVFDNLSELWADDMLYTMPVLDAGIPTILNDLLKRSDLELFFVTERQLKRPEKTIKIMVFNHI